MESNNNSLAENDGYIFGHLDIQEKNFLKLINEDKIDEIQLYISENFDINSFNRKSINLLSYSISVSAIKCFKFFVGQFILSEEIIDQYATKTYPEFFDYVIDSFNNKNSLIHPFKFFQTILDNGNLELARHIIDEYSDDIDKLNYASNPLFFRTKQNYNFFKEICQYIILTTNFPIEKFIGNKILVRENDVNLIPPEEYYFEISKALINDTDLDFKYMSEFRDIMNNFLKQYINHPKNNYAKTFSLFKKFLEAENEQNNIEYFSENAHLLNSEILSMVIDHFDLENKLIFLNKIFDKPISPSNFYVNNDKNNFLDKKHILNYLNNIQLSTDMVYEKDLILIKNVKSKIINHKNYNPYHPSNLRITNFEELIFIFQNFTSKFIDINDNNIRSFSEISNELNRIIDNKNHTVDFRNIALKIKNLFFKIVIDTLNLTINDLNDNLEIYEELSTLIEIIKNNERQTYNKLLQYDYLSLFNLIIDDFINLNIFNENEYKEIENIKKYAYQKEDPCFLNYNFKNFFWKPIFVKNKSENLENILNKFDNLGFTDKFENNNSKNNLGKF